MNVHVTSTKYFWQQRTVICSNCADNDNTGSYTRKKKVHQVIDKIRLWRPGVKNTGGNLRIVKSQLEIQEKALLSICKSLSWGRVNHRITGSQNWPAWVKELWSNSYYFADSIFFLAETARILPFQATNSTNSASPQASKPTAALTPTCST